MSRNPGLYKTLVFGVIVLFIGVGIQPAFANDVSTNTKPSEQSNLAILYGRINNLHECVYETTFNAVHLRIISLTPLGFYRLNSGEKVQIWKEGASGFHWGILNNYIIFALCMNPQW